MSENIHCCLLFLSSSTIWHHIPQNNTNEGCLLTLSMKNKKWLTSCRRRKRRHISRLMSFKRNFNTGHWKRSNNRLSYIYCMNILHAIHLSSEHTYAVHLSCEHTSCVTPERPGWMCVPFAPLWYGSHDLIMATGVAVEHAISYHDQWQSQSINFSHNLW